MTAPARTSTDTPTTSSPPSWLPAHDGEQRTGASDSADERARDRESPQNGPVLDTLTLIVVGLIESYAIRGAGNPR